MINRFQLLRNVGQFDNAAGGALPLQRLTLIYAENGRGKTTLSAVLRSLASGRPELIAERQRLPALNAPHVVMDCVGGPPVATFQNGAWNRTLPDLVIFDDVFVDENVYSGLTVQSDHRQRLHELILGARGVALNRQVQEFAARIEVHNAALRARAAAIPPGSLDGLSVDVFCLLPVRADIGAAIEQAERSVAAAREQAPIREARAFDGLGLPAFDIDAIERALAMDVAGLDARAAARVQQHLQVLPAGSEAWVADGMRRVTAAGGCPFCAQDLGGSQVLAHYRAFFSEDYQALKRTVADGLGAVQRVHGGDAPANFERAVRITSERRQFWARFAEMPEVGLDTAAITADWRRAREHVAAALTAKQLSPLDRMTLSQEARQAIAAHDAHRAHVAELDQRLRAANQAVAIVKERVAGANPATLAADLSRLRATQERHEPAIAPLCEAYLQEKAAKIATEQARDQARAALEQYRQGVFPGYQAAINGYLQRFNAGFRLNQVEAANTRGGPSCTYNVVINNTPVPVGGADPVAGRPSFRNTLSAGDRNTLALAFFFASLDMDPGLANRIVLIDDPVSSLDEHRSLTTVQELRALAGRAAQVIVLSHSKPFLCSIWEGADRLQRAAMIIRRDGAGSALEAWPVDNDAVTEHDRRHALLREYLAVGRGNSRDVAVALRPVMEAFCRVAYPAIFPPGQLLGPFREVCRQRVGQATQVLDAADVRELEELVEYANRFHHDTNPAWQTAAVNDGELRGFVDRTLRFCSR